MNLIQKKYLRFFSTFACIARIILLGIFLCLWFFCLRCTFLAAKWCSVPIASRLRRHNPFKCGGEQWTHGLEASTTIVMSNETTVMRCYYAVLWPSIRRSMVAIYCQMDKVIKTINNFTFVKLGREYICIIAMVRPPNNVNSTFHVHFANAFQVNIFTMRKNTSKLPFFCINSGKNFFCSQLSGMDGAEYDRRWFNFCKSGFSSSSFCSPCVAGDLLANGVGTSSSTHYRSTATVGMMENIANTFQSFKLMERIDSWAGNEIHRPLEAPSNNNLFLNKHNAQRMKESNALCGNKSQKRENNNENHRKVNVSSSMCTFQLTVWHLLEFPLLLPSILVHVCLSERGGVRVTLYRVNMNTMDRPRSANNIWCNEWTKKRKIHSYSFSSMLAQCLFSTHFPCFDAIWMYLLVSALGGLMFHINVCAAWPWAPHQRTVTFRNVCVCVLFVCKLLGITKHRNRTFTAHCTHSIAQSSHCIAYDYLSFAFGRWIIHLVKCEPCSEWFGLISSRLRVCLVIDACPVIMLPAIFVSSIMHGHEIEFSVLFICPHSVWRVQFPKWLNRNVKAPNCLPISTVHQYWRRSNILHFISCKCSHVHGDVHSNSVRHNSIFHKVKRKFSLMETPTRAHSRSARKKRVCVCIGLALFREHVSCTTYRTTNMIAWNQTYTEDGGVTKANFKMSSQSIFTNGMAFRPKPIIFSFILWTSQQKNEAK